MPDIKNTIEYRQIRRETEQKIADSMAPLLKRIEVLEAQMKALLARLENPDPAP